MNRRIGTESNAFVDIVDAALRGNIVIVSSDEIVTPPSEVVFKIMWGKHLKYVIKQGLNVIIMVTSGKIDPQLLKKITE